jgi:hypothetical protein
MTEQFTESQETNKPPYFPIESLLDMIEGENGDACKRIYSDFKDEFGAAPGSSHNHQAWPGGYIDHVTDAMNVGLSVYELYNEQRPLPFTASDVLLIVYLHDLEKPFKYTFSDTYVSEKREQFPDKNAGEVFKRELIERYGIQLNEMQDNALEFVEGIRDHKYQRGKRVMGELAVVCHIADLTSARLWYNHPLAEDDTWSGSARQNTAASGITLPSEIIQ